MVCFPHRWICSKIWGHSKSHKTQYWIRSSFTSYFLSHPCDVNHCPTVTSVLLSHNTFIGRHNVWL